MLAELIRSNLERDPARAALLHGVTGTINVHARDAEVTCGLEFAGGKLHVFAEPFRRAGIEIHADSGALMGMSSVPLRFGLPDPMKSDGRAVFKQMLRGELKVKGMIAHPVMMMRLQKLLAV